MAILTAIFANWKAAAYGLLAAALLIAGWQVNGWRQDAARLDDAKAALRTAQEKMASAQRMAVKADEDRATLGLQLTEAELALKEASKNAKTVIRRVFVQTDPRCDLEPSVVRVLRDARSGTPIVPPAPDNAPNTTGAPTTPPRQ